VRMKDAGVLVLLAAIWGASYLFIGVASEPLGPIVVALARVVVASGGLLAWIAVSRRWRELAAGRRFIVLGLSNAALPYCLIAFAELHLTASLAAVLNATTPLFTMLVATAWNRTRLTAPALAGCLLGAAGVGFLVGWNPGAANLWFVLAVIAMLGASLLYGIASVYAKRALTGVSALGAATGQQLGAALVLAPFGLAAIATRHPAALPSAHVALAVLALGLGCTSMAYLLYFRLIAAVGAVNTSSVTFLIPIFGILWSRLFLGEAAPPGALIGAGLIFGGILLVTGRISPSTLARRPAFRSF
jgi:drug/metabolite transporter (DMT)-like permease